MKSFCYFFFIVLFILSCSPKAFVVDLEKDTGWKNTSYLTFSNGSYSQDSLDRNPVSTLGSEGFLKSLYSNVTYPVTARNAGISGIVVLELSIDEKGNLIDSIVKESLSPECDQEVLRAVRKACEAGFFPAIKDGKAVAVKFDFPFKFRLA